jgi:hypothetical protein
MRNLSGLWAAAILPMLPFIAPGAETAAAPLQPGSVFNLRGRPATLQTLDTLPCVETEYTRRFRFDSWQNPKLKTLRERCRLEEVVAPGRDEFDRQVRLMDWTHQQFRRFGQPSIQARGALEILQGIEEGGAFFCAQYAQLLVSAAASLGWVDRPLALRRHQGVAKVGGSTEHSTTEIWSNQHRKWVMLDPTANLHLERDGVPLNAHEIRQEWFYRHGTNLSFVVGREGGRYRKSDLPVFLRRFAGFGDLAIHPDELDKYGFIGYIPNTDLMDAGFDYAAMLITKDQLCDGTKWHTRPAPADPAVDLYFPIGQAAMKLAVERGQVRVSLSTLTPNFLRYEARTDDGPWRRVESVVEWEIHEGRNRLEARTVNQFQVVGPVSTAVLHWGN